MENQTVEFTEELRKLTIKDKAHAKVFNEFFGKLLQNDLFLNTLVTAIQESFEQHNQESAIHIEKLSHIADGAEVNQFAFSRINVGDLKVTANEKTSTITLQAGSNITIQADNASKKIVITANRDGGNANLLGGHQADYFNENIRIHPPFFINSSTYGTYAAAIIAKKKEGYQGGMIHASSYQAPDLPSGVNASWSTIIWRSSCNNAVFSIELYIDRVPIVYKGTLVDGENQSKITWARENDGGNAATLDGHAASYFAVKNEVTNALNLKANLDHGHDGRYHTKQEITNFLNQKANSNHNHNGGKYLAGQGTNGGYSFTNDGAEDTGMFSDKDGDLYFMQNGVKRIPSYDGHDHNGSYYTKPEIDNAMNGKLSTGASCNKNWNWAGQEGQPTWVWGGNEINNMYVYNPRNFHVNYADSAGSAGSASKLTANAGSSMQPVYFSGGVPVATSVRGVAIQSSTPSNTSVLWAW